MSTNNSDDESDNKAQSYRSMIIAAFNGPPVIGIGGSTDQGLSSAQYHVVPFSPSKHVTMKITSHDGVLGFDVTGDPQWEIVASDVVREEAGKASSSAKPKVLQPNQVFKDLADTVVAKYVDYNVENVYHFDKAASDANITDAAYLRSVKRDIRGILAMYLGCNLYGGEIHGPTKSSKSHRNVMTASEWAELQSADNANRCLTWMAARVHTKYQTNHSMGGTVAQGAMASCMRAYYGLFMHKGMQEEDRRKYQFLYKSLYWALHPINEPFMLAQILNRHRLSTFKVHCNSSEPFIFEQAEYMQIRAGVTAASTHNFAVGVACAIRLKDFGLLAFLPNPARLTTLGFGFRQAQFYGAQCHPAARFWGLSRVTLSQRSVSDVVADLAYAVKHLFPADTLAGSPACKDESGVSLAWKTFVDGIRSKMEDSVAEIIKPETMAKVLPKLTAGTEDHSPDIIKDLLEPDLDEVFNEGGWTGAAKALMDKFAAK